MITPVFRVEQDVEFVRVLITAPHLNLAAVDFAIDGSQFKFVSHPYFLRLQLPSEVIEDGRESCTFDADTGLVTASLPKKVKGEVFVGLDLLTTLLAKKGPARAAGPLIEVIGGASIDSVSEFDHVPATDAGIDGLHSSAAAARPRDDFDWELEQTLPEETHSADDAMGVARYGFALRYSGTLGKICHEVPGVIELSDPDHTPISARKAERVAAEDAQFDSEHYACDHAEKDEPGTMLYEALQFVPTWSGWHEGRCASDDGAAPADDERPQLRFTSNETEEMRRLPRKEYLVDAVKPELIGLIDIVYSWAYNHRITQGDHTVESAWTIGTVSATLSFLARHDTVYEAVVASLRRAVAYPLVRSFALAAQVLEDTQKIFRMGVRGVLKCLLDARSVLARDEVKRYLADIYLTDYCVWLQTLSEKAMRALSTKLDAIDVEIDEIGWPLAQIEAIVDNDDSEDSDEGSNDEGSDIDSPSEGKECELEDGDGTRRPLIEEVDAAPPSPPAITLIANSLGSVSLDPDVGSTSKDGSAVIPWRFANPWIDTRKLPTREMTFCDTLVVVQQHVDAEIDVKHNTGLILWDAAYVLGRYFEVHLGSRYFREKKVIELGAGTGLPSIVAALLGAAVLATDLDEALPLLQSNVDCATTRSPTLKLAVEKLVWSTDVAHKLESFDVIVCSEVIYDRECHKLLLGCINALASPSTEIFFAYKRRALGEDDFVQLLHDSDCHHVVVVQQDVIEPDFRDAGIGILRVKLVATTDKMPVSIKDISELEHTE